MGWAPVSIVPPHAEYHCANDHRNPPPANYGKDSKDLLVMAEKQGY